MVCGRLARRIASVMFRKGIAITEILFTLPKPLAHLFFTSLRLCLMEYQKRVCTLTSI